MTIVTATPIFTIDKLDQNFNQVAELRFGDVVNRAIGGHTDRFFILNTTSEIQIWDFDFKTLNTYLIKTITPAGSPTLRCTYPNGRFIMGNNNGSAINTYDWEGNLIRSVTLGTTNQFGITSNDRFFYTGRRNDTNIYMWDQNGNLLRTFSDGTSNVVTCHWDIRKRQLFVMHNDQSGLLNSSTLNIFDESGHLLRTAFLGGLISPGGQVDCRGLITDDRYIYLAQNRWDP